MVKKNYILFKVLYIGDRYHGSQRQPNLLTVEGQLLSALHKKGYISDQDFEKQVIHSAGRTDAGVHARGMTYGIFNQREDFHPIEVNTALPEDIIIWGATNTEIIDNLPKVHPRYQATQRHYKYFVSDPNKSYNLELMQECVKKLCGTHDFHNFSKTGDTTETIRTVDEISVNMEGDLCIFDFYARSFLWHQIRNMMRVILQIGSKKWKMEVVSSLFDPDDKKYALKIEPMPPNGLILWNVLYSNIDFELCVASHTKLNRVVTEWLDRLKVRNSILESIKSSFK